MEKYGPFKLILEHEGRVLLYTFQKTFETGTNANLDWDKHAFENEPN